MPVPIKCFETGKRSLPTAYIFKIRLLFFALPKDIVLANGKPGDDALRYAFEDCVFDTDRRELRRGFSVIPTAPQAFDLLEYLIRNRERVVSKDDLVAAIWRGRAISDAALTTRLNAARAAIGNFGEEQRLIKTLQRRGFRFICAVQELPAPTRVAIVETPTEQANATLPSMSTNRRLAAIVFGDLAGYYAAMKHDEEGTAAAVRALRRKVIEPKLAEYQGRLIVAVTNSFIAEFASPLAALKCSLAIQSQLATENVIALKLRIGLNLGDIIVEDGGNVHGEGVMVASRLQELADPGGILMSDKIFYEVEGKIDVAFEDRGEMTVTNVLRPLRVFHTSSLLKKFLRPKCPIRATIESSELASQINLTLRPRCLILMLLTDPLEKPFSANC